MKTYRFFQAAMLMMLCVGFAQAQNNLGELLDRNAKKISKDEWLAMLPISASAVWFDKNGEAQLTYKPDGTFAGTARHYPSGSSSGASGTWTVDETGNVCIDEKFADWPATFKGCTFRFKLGKEFFNVISDQDRNAQAFKTTLTK